jgi:ABC-type transporter Mla MlaB component
MSQALSQTATANAVIKLDANLGIEQAAALHETLKQRVDDTDLVQFDASELQRIHTAALQLFCLFCRDRRRAGHSVEFLRPSESLRNAAALLGATTLLQLAKAHP